MASPMQRAAMAALLFAPTSLAVLRGGKIVPELKDYPLSDESGQSHKDFFDRDNPADDRLGVHNDFPHSYPWPKLQHHVTYDSDYVKDENTDHGEWDVKMGYDVARNKYRSREIVVEKEQSDVKKHLAALHEAESDQQAAQKAVMKAHLQAAQAQQDADAAKTRLEQLAGKVGSESGAGELGSAQEHVNEAIKKFEECQKELEEQKAKLKEVMAERDAKLAEEAAKAANATNGSSADVEKEVAENEAAVAASEAKTKEEEKSVAELRAELREAEARLDEVRAKHSESARRGAYPRPASSPAEPEPTAPAPAPEKAGASRSSAAFVAAMALAAAATSTL
eukprot:TRINITY_DN26296_c1_g1_i1.p1 TRINITY_DN26296_c1_g1~~TRINITY_DN26296_c1_g1_i1.p1  ORF type:complete len:338 (-),score=111.12 TRINITY_DN26296_c1_g1_i1:168-1181(-)